MLDANVECQSLLNANVGVSYKGPAQNPQIGENGPKCVENGRQVLRIGRHESHGSSGAFGICLAHSFFWILDRTPLSETSTLAFNIGIQHWYSTLAFNIGIQNWHSTLAFNIAIQHWHSTLAFNIGIRH